MSSPDALLLAAAAILALYLLGVVALILASRRSDARALAGFVPDCLILFRRLVKDPRIGRGRRLMLVALVGYLALPVDLVPDFIPVAGQLDDAILVVLILRHVLRGGGPQLLREHWPGPEASLNVLLRLAYGEAASPSRVV